MNVIREDVEVIVRAYDLEGNVMDQAIMEARYVSDFIWRNRKHPKVVVTDILGDKLLVAKYGVIEPDRYQTSLQVIINPKQDKNRSAKTQAC